MVLILVPLLLLVLPLPPTKGKWAVHKQDWILGGAIAFSITSLAIYLLRARRALPLIVFGTSLLLAGNVVWNKAFRAYVDRQPEDSPAFREVFRRAMHRTFHWPVYGRYDNAIARYEERGGYSFATLPWVVAASAIAAAWLWWAIRRPMDRRWDARSFVVLIAFQLALILTFALCEPWPKRLSLQISGYAEFAKDLPRFVDIRDTLRRYVELMPTLEWYGQHYPPGNLILLQIEKSLGIPGFTKSIVVLLTALAVVPLYKLAKELDLDNTAASLAVLLFAMSSSVLILCTINTTPIVLFPGTMCLWMLTRALKTGSARAAGGLGLFFALYLMFSFSASILGVLMALTTVLGWRDGVFTMRNVARTAAISLAVVVIAVALVYVATGFNVVNCFMTAVRGHQDQQGNAGFDDAPRYLLRSTGNILAYLISAVPLCILAISALAHMWSSRDRSAARAIVSAVCLTIVFAGFSGLFYVETERIWIFLTPVLALAAGYEVSRRMQRGEAGLATVMLPLVIVISCTQEFLFMHYR